MIFNFDKKEYDSEKLSDQGKIVLQKLQNIVLQKQQLTIQFTDLEVLQKHYSDLLSKELPEEEKTTSEMLQEGFDREQKGA
jgi:hypothetical protein|tara:strand:- start:112 stop:354 length:243 start_codon:yes stop_codon:yes gene_type:complete